MIDIFIFLMIMFIVITAAIFGTFMILVRPAVFQVFQNIRRLGEQVPLVVRVAVAPVATRVFCKIRSSRGKYNINLRVGWYRESDICCEARSFLPFSMAEKLSEKHLLGTLTNTPTSTIFYSSKEHLLYLQNFSRMRTP